MTKKETENHNTGCRTAGWMMLALGIFVGVVLDVVGYRETGTWIGFFPACIVLFGLVSVAAFCSIREVPDE